MQMWMLAIIGAIREPDGGRRNCLAEYKSLVIVDRGPSGGNEAVLCRISRGNAPGTVGNTLEMNSGFSDSRHRVERLEEQRGGLIRS
jgi:hypothetical protein